MAKRTRYLTHLGHFMPVPTPDVPHGMGCNSCGMGTYRQEYHPWAACELFKATRSSDSVRANIEAVVAFGAKHRPEEG